MLGFASYARDRCSLIPPPQDCFNQPVYVCGLALHAGIFCQVSWLFVQFLEDGCVCQWFTYVECSPLQALL